MKCSRALVAAVTLTAAGAGTAAADIRPDSFSCNGQSLKTCAAFLITTADDQSGGTSVLLQVRNLVDQYVQNSSEASRPDHGSVSFQLAADFSLFAPDPSWCDPGTRRLNCPQTQVVPTPDPGTTATPEPAGMLLVATGLVGLAAAGFVRRRRKDNG